MAWSTTRARSSGSRRDARGRFVGSALGIAAVVAGFALLGVSRLAPERMGGLRQAALEAAAPVWDAARVPLAAITDTLDGMGAYWDAANRVQGLEADLVQARRAGADAALLAAENRRLKRLLRFSEGNRQRVAVARMAGGSGASLVETAVVSAGTDAGVRTGQPVTIDTGLLGRVTEVSARAARVLLVSDPESRVPVRIVRTGAPAVLAGVGGGMTELRFVDGKPDAGPRAGDMIVTSGEGGLFAPDIAVARVEAVAGDVARARPVARPDTLGFAVIEAAWLPAPPAIAAVATPKPVRMAAMVNP